MNANIYLLGHEDAKAVSRLEDMCFSSFWSENVYKQILTDSRIHLNIISKPGTNYPLPMLAVFGIIEKDKLCAYLSIRLILSAGLAEVYNIAVLPELQGQGLGAFLLKRIISYLELREVEEISLELRETNDAAMALYLKNGFITSGVRKDYYPDGENAILMTRYKGSIPSFAV